MEAYSSLTTGQVDIPYVATYKSVSTGQTMKVSGIWTGATSCNFQGHVRLVERLPPRGDEEASTS